MRAARRDLSYNQLSGSIPDTLGQLTALQTLYVWRVVWRVRRMRGLRAVDGGGGEGVGCARAGWDGVGGGRGRCVYVCVLGGELDGRARVLTDDVSVCAPPAGL